MGPSRQLIAAEARWQVASVTIARPGGDPVFDPDTGTYEPAPPAVVYAGPCDVHPVGRDEVVEYGEGPQSLRQYDVKLTGMDADIRVGDDATFVSAADPSLDGLAMQVVDVKKRARPTNRWIVCEEAMR
jgi:hypothetical protein